MSDILWFVMIKDDTGKLTIQSMVAPTYDEAAVKVLANPKIKNVVSYGKLVNKRLIVGKEYIWVNLNEQN